ncbi:MAG: adenylate/guanylate cyclase domain-containing protein [Alphaproteobacteria bacterium]|nr:adenylate/guanylate cyclase domain-containing protein [Alphaproteobacteria bacterium]
MNEVEKRPAVPGVGLTTIVKTALPWESHRNLPRRIIQSIERQDQTSEVLAKLIQLAVVSIMAVLYLASPKTDAGTAFSPVPYALSIYIVLNIIGLIWALRWGLKDWAVYGSICIDMTLLMVLIWSFHIQYEQPASFYLKAPTILYAFIFIAIRAMRYQARFVVAAGVLASLGWTAMVIYVIRIDPENTMITRNYVEYLTSNSVLIGAELDKIITILLVTAILALALRRGYALLVNAIRDQQAAQELSRFFDASVASQITTADQSIAAGEGATREAAVLNIDIRGFTTMASAMPASEVMGILTAYQGQLVPIIQQNGGTIDKFLGDGIMATFGALAPSETYAADSLRAVDEIMANVLTWSEIPELERFTSHSINAAVAGGPISVGAVGDEKRLEFTVIGPAVNLSAKLEKHNKVPGTRALTTAELLDTAKEQGYVPEHEIELVSSEVEGTSGAFQLAVLHA